MPRKARNAAATSAAATRIPGVVATPPLPPASQHPQQPWPAQTQPATSPAHHPTVVALYSGKWMLTIGRDVPWPAGSAPRVVGCHCHDHGPASRPLPPPECVLGSAEDAPGVVTPRELGDPGRNGGPVERARRLRARRGLKGCEQVLGFRPRRPP